MAEFVTNEVIIKRELWTQTEGEAKLEVRGGALEIALFVEGAPLIFDAADCAGSVGRFTVLLEETRPTIARQIETAAASGFAADAPLSQQIAPLLKLLPNGRYSLTLAPMRQGSLQYAFDDYQHNETSLWYLPYAHLPGYQIADVYLGTQPESSLRDATINRYLAAIDSGERPALIALGAKNHVARFILDGHHKLMAYWCCGIEPIVLNIEAEKMVPISYEQAAQLLENAPPIDVPRYLRAKRPKIW